ncbi:MAG TPA: hypothetical protein VEZ46_09655 [Mycobacteriales bacterium]|nr:hypothetical protein [Mycobacteriales bacterium]
MVTTILTHDTGGMLKPGPMLTVAPDREQTDDALSGVAAGSGLNAPFVADLLSACLMHERMGVPLFRSLGAMTANPALQPMFAQYRQETEQAVAVWEQLVTSIGGDPQYVSPRRG